MHLLLELFLLVCFLTHVIHSRYSNKQIGCSPATVIIRLNITCKFDFMLEHASNLKLFFYALAIQWQRALSTASVRPYVGTFVWKSRKWNPSTPLLGILWYFTTMLGLMPSCAWRQEFAVTCSLQKLWPLCKGSRQGHLSHSVTNFRFYFIYMKYLVWCLFV